MEPDTPDKLDQFNQSNYRPLFQETSTDPQESDQSKPLFTRPQNTVSAGQRDGQSPWMSQMIDTANRRWGDNGQGQNVNNSGSSFGTRNALDPNLENLGLKPEDKKYLSDCSRAGFWIFTLPSLIGFAGYKQYNSVKTLRPLSGTTIFFQSVFVYFLTKMLASSVCWARLANKNPDLMKRVEEMANSRRSTYNQRYLNSPINQQYPNNPINSQYPIRPNNQNIPKSEFVDENYNESGYSSNGN